MAKNLTVVLTSGGLNAAVAVSLARQDGPVALLYLRYGHPAGEPEQAAFRALCEHYRPSHRLVASLGEWRELTGSALLTPNGDIEDAPTIGNRLAGTFVPMLAPVMLCAAAAWAATLGAARVVWGINLDNPGNYPDHADAVRLLAGQLVGRSLPEDKAPSIDAPLAQYDKTAVVELARQLNVPIDLTWSCLRGGETPCGRCIGCATRKAALVTPVIR
jgi:7-cyano-7-deazaguanine synthase